MTAPLKITFAIPYFYPAWQYGGQPRAAYELARSLVQRGHRVKVLTTDSGGTSRLPEAITGQTGPQIVDGIEVFYYRNLSNDLAFKQRIFWPPSLFREVKRQLSGSDILHIHELRSPVTVSAAASAHALGVPYVISTHGGIRHLGRQGIKVIYDRLWGVKILKRAAAVIAISPVEEADMKTFGVDPAKIVELPNMIAPEDYEHLPEPGEFRRKWNLADKRVVLFLGRLHWIKGADLLIETFQDFIKDHADSHLVVAGPDDGQGQELRQLTTRLGLDSRVTFTGQCNHQEKMQAFVDADLLVVPSRSEVFAITVIEALACGCPVLLSDACGLHPMPGRSEGVAHFATGNRADLLEKLRQAMGDSSLHPAAAAGRQFVLNEFASGTVSLRAEMIYYRIVSGSAKERG